MNIIKNGWMLTSAPCLWFLCNKVGEEKKKKKVKVDAEIFENLKKLHELKETGVITEEDYCEVKERLMKQL